MKTRKILLNVDLVIQGILILLAILGAITTAVTFGEAGIALGYALLLLGGWQLGSGVFMGIILRDEVRAKYFLGSVIYLLLIATFGDFLPKNNDHVWKIFGVIFIVIIPMLIAFWYFKLTKSTIKKIEMNIEVPSEMKDILDSEEIFRPIEE